MTRKFIWTEKYSVKVTELDEQHKSFFDICNKLLEMVQKEEPIVKDEALMKIMKLADYASYHLSSEEQFFKDSGYPDADFHIQVHDKFREKVRDFIGRAGSADSDIQAIVIEAANFAGEWLMRHILDMDQKYSPYLNERGIK